MPALTCEPRGGHGGLDWVVADDDQHNCDDIADHSQEPERLDRPALVLECLAAVLRGERGPPAQSKQPLYTYNL